MTKRPAAFESEVALCTAFLGAVDKAKWTPYPETAGWDILMVRNADGFQIGIQAKLRLNIDVINQAIDERGHWDAGAAGPDCRALLVPASSGFERICKYLALVIITADPQVSTRSYPPMVRPLLPLAPPAYQSDEWPEWAPAKRHKLPEYVPDVPAGASAPVQLTDWKIKAIKLAVMLELRGRVLRADFAYLQLDHRRWIDGRWLMLRDGSFVAGPGMPNFRMQHPKVYEQIATDAPKWMEKKLVS